MARPKKEERKQVSVTLPVNKLTTYKIVALEKGLPLCDLIEKLLDEHINKIDTVVSA